MSNKEWRGFSTFEARQYWKGVKKTWESVATEIGNEIQKIEDETLRKAVLRLIGALSKGQGEFKLTHTPDGFRIADFELDDAAFDALVAEFGEDYDFSIPSDWVVQMVRGMPAPFVGWAFGPLKVAPLNGVPESEQNLVHFSHGRMVYSAKEQKVIGVLSHPDPHHPNCKVIRVEI